MGLRGRNVLSKVMPSVPTLDQRVEGIDKKLEKAYYKIRKIAENRKKRRKRGNATWEPKVNEKVCVLHSAYKLKDEWGKGRGEFNKKQLKQYREEKKEGTMKAKK